MKLLVLGDLALTGDWHSPRWMGVVIPQWKRRKRLDFIRKGHIFPHNCAILSHFGQVCLSLCVDVNVRYCIFRSWPIGPWPVVGDSLAGRTLRIDDFFWINWFFAQRLGSIGKKQQIKGADDPWHQDVRKEPWNKHPSGSQFPYSYNKERGFLVVTCLRDVGATQEFGLLGIG